MGNLNNPARFVFLVLSSRVDLGEEETAERLRIRYFVTLEKHLKRLKWKMSVINARV